MVESKSGGNALNSSNMFASHQIIDSKKKDAKSDKIMSENYQNLNSSDSDSSSSTNDSESVKSDKKRS